MKRILFKAGEQISPKLIENVYKQFYGSNLDKYTIDCLEDTINDINLTARGLSAWNCLIQTAKEYFITFTFSKNLSYTITTKESN
jgi:hypothetical protein